jgi:hypothetical protein
MNIDMFAAAEALSDSDLLSHIDRLAGAERSATAELVAHLAVLHSRPSVYAALGYGSLFNYCTQALKLSEDAACNRIETAKICGRFPVLLLRLASGEMTMSSVRLVGRHLTAENHEAVIEGAKGCTLREIGILIAELAPRPDAPAFLRKLPRPSPRPEKGDAMVAMATDVLSEPPTSTIAAPAPATTALAESASPAPPAKVRRPIIEPTAPDRYRLQFTIAQETRDRLRRVQALLGREIPGGDPGAIFDRALKLLEAQLEKTKLAAVTRPQPKPSIRRATDKPVSRHIPHEVKRAVCGCGTAPNAPSWRRAGGGARTARTSSGITSSPTPGRGRRRSPTSPCAAGGTTNTKRRCSSGRSVPTCRARTRSGRLHLTRRRRAAGSG